MKKTTFIATIGLAIAVLFAIDLPATAQKKGKTRPLTSAQMMSGLIKPQFVSLQQGLKENPTTDEQWKALATSAALLNESSYMLMEDGRSPDKPWEEGSMILRKASLELLADIDKKDAVAATAKMAIVVKSCKVCHAEHKYKKKS